MQDTLGSWRIAVTALSVTAATAKTAIQYKAGTASTAEILSFTVSQTASSTSQLEGIRVLRKTGAATVTAGATGTNIFDLTGGAGTLRASTGVSATGVNASAEGTDGDVLFETSLNTAGGFYEWNAQPNMRLWVPASGIIALKLLGIISGTYAVQMFVRESL